MSLPSVSESGIASLWSRVNRQPSEPAATSPVMNTSGAASGNVSSGPAVWSASDPARQAVSQSLQQALALWQQQQSSQLKQAQQRKQSNSQPLDANRMKMLKERVKNLRQMLVGKDKGSLRAIALQLKQITAELRQMVANASGQGQASVMEVSVNVTISGSVSSDQTDHAADQADSAVASTDDAAMASSDSSTAEPAQAAMASSASTGNQGLGGNMELQALLNSIKAIAQWLKQRSQQSQGQDEGLKKWLDGSQEDLAAIDHMLAGGSNNAQGELSVSIQLATGGDAGESATSDAGSAGNVNVQA
ncbi:hypothetical protein [Aquitalea sp. LB_tupeE]|uniref:hypothetical protein n=1 Tax=Aquitalea sp. LB_tupeE TaxID=2748078 RepID=UPI0015BF61B0|nr:hypothetical protein [Aquitalea sp. LB_tupeE]NWK78708.1 hypothetical protein [Aquitalea sp. LB_tupeE]